MVEEVGKVRSREAREAERAAGPVGGQEKVRPRMASIVEYKARYKAMI